MASCQPVSLTVDCKRNYDHGADEHDRYQNKHGEGQRRDQVARDHSGVSEMREHVRIKQREEPQLVEEERARIGRRREIEVEAGRGLVERTAVRSTDDLLEHGGRRHRVRLSSTGNSLALAVSLSAPSAAGESGDFVTIRVATFPAAARKRWRLGSAAPFARRVATARLTNRPISFTSLMA
jgi:hypothetical protein